METKNKQIKYIFRNLRISGEYLIIYSDSTSELFQNGYGFIESFNQTQTAEIKTDLQEVN